MCHGKKKSTESLQNSTLAEIMSDDENSDKDHREVVSKAEKLKQIEETLKSLEDGTSELYKSSGPSSVWKKFMLIRDVQTKKRIEFTQCTECKALLTFKENSGNSHLRRHKCRIDQDALEEESKHRTLAPETARQVQNSIIQNIMKYCADEFITWEKICQSPQFVDFAQSFVSLALKHGNVCLKDLFPNSNAMNREIEKFKDEKQQEIYQNFRRTLNNNWCSASLCFQNFNGSMEKVLVIMRLQYYANNFSSLQNKVILTAPCDTKNPDGFLDNLVKRFKHFGGDEKDLHRMKIVTANDKIFLKAFSYPFSRSRCVVNTIIEVLDAAFKESASNELNDFFVSCGKIVRYINDSDKYYFMLNCDNGSWKDKLLMMESINKYHDEMLAISKDDNKFAFQFNKRRAEELISLLSPFVEAADDLSASSYTTANKIFVWWSVLNEHLQTCNDYSNDLKGIMLRARDRFELSFPATMDDKINALLDPRFKQLLMLKDSERAEVIKEVRNLLQDLPIENDDDEASTSTGITKAKRSRLEHFESQKQKHKDRPKTRVQPSNKEKGKSRLSKYEANESNIEENDEVKMYLKLPLLNSSNFENEFDIMKKFWQSKQKALPKLYKLATTRLHVPAYCGSVEESVITMKESLKDEYMNDLLFFRDDLKSE